MPKLRESSNKNKHAPQARSGASVPWASPLRFLAGAALIAVLAFIVYFPSISGEFVLDDNLYLTENQLITTADGLYRFWCTTEPEDYYPVTYTTFWIEWRLWGLGTTGYHVTNLVLHIAESLLIWIILRKLSIPGAFLAALIFAVHPVNVESVAWIAQRKGMLAMLFFLLSILCYLKFIELARLRLAAKQSTSSSLISHPSSLFYWLSLAMFLLAILSKGSAVVLPVLLLGITWWLRPLTLRDLMRSVPFFAVALVLTVVNILFMARVTSGGIRDIGFIERLLGAGGVIWFYLYKALVPLKLIFVYPKWHIEDGNFLWWLPLVAAMVVTALLWRYRETWSRPFLFAWGFFCAALLPVMGFTDVGYMQYSLVADHYQHIAIIGVISLAAAGWSVWHRQARRAEHWAATAVAIVALGILAFLTFRQSDFYRDPITLYQATLEKNTDCSMVYNNLGNALVQAGRPEKAIEYFQQALRLKPDYIDAYNNLGIALAKMNRLKEAIEQYRRALVLKPEYADAHNNLGAALVQTGRTQEAIEHYEQALRLKPDDPEYHKNLGSVFKSLGQYQQAIEHYGQAILLKSDYPEANYDLGNILSETGLPQEAIDYYKQALLLKPDYPEAHYNLGNILLKTSRLQEAAEHFRQALLLKPDYTEACNNLGLTLANLGRPQEAIEYYQQALRLKPDFTEVYFNLALAHVRMRHSSQAIAAAQKVIELAKSQGHSALAKQTEDWLNAYRAGLSDPSNPARASESAPPLP